MIEVSTITLLVSSNENAPSRSVAPHNINVLCYESVILIQDNPNDKTLTDLIISADVPFLCDPSCHPHTEYF